MRKQIIMTTFFSALLILAVTSPLLAQGCPGGYGQGGQGFGHGGPYFDPETLVTVSGTLTLDDEEWQPQGHGNHTGGGVHATLLADDGTSYELMLAPEWFLEESSFFLEDGDPVTVTGSRVASYGGTLGGPGNGHGHGHGGGPGGGGGDPENDFLIVTVLESDGASLTLRNDDGYPVWRGGPGWQGEHFFDPATVATFGGHLEEALGLWSSWGYGNHTGNSMHYRFQSDGGEAFYAMLGPWWYLEQNGIDLEDGLAIEITGSVVEPYWNGYDDLRYLVASEVAVGDVRVTLRDEDGYPVWHGTGWHYYAPAWTPADRSVTGTIRRTQTRAHGGRLDPGYEVVLRSGGRNYVGFLAPQWYVEMRRLGFAAGDRITLHGAYTRENGRHEIVVRAVNANGRTYRLRNARGVPFWIHGAR